MKRERAPRFKCSVGFGVTSAAVLPTQTLRSGDTV